MDKKLKSECLALVLLFAGFPIISFGATGSYALLWWIGLVSLVVGGLLPISTRFMDHTGDRIRDQGLEFDERTS